MAFARSPAYVHTVVCRAASRTTGIEEPSTKFSRSLISANRAEARRESVQPGSSPAATRSIARPTVADNGCPEPSQRDLPASRPTQRQSFFWPFDADDPPAPAAEQDHDGSVVPSGEAGGIHGAEFCPAMPHREEHRAAEGRHNIHDVPAPEFPFAHPSHPENTLVLGEHTPSEPFCCL
jgi:hypothetical protein